MSGSASLHLKRVRNRRPPADLRLCACGLFDIGRPNHACFRERGSTQFPVRFTLDPSGLLIDGVLSVARHGLPKSSVNLTGPAVRIRPTRSRGNARVLGGGWPRLPIALRQTAGALDSVA